MSPLRVRVPVDLTVSAASDPVASFEGEKHDVPNVVLPPVPSPRDCKTPYCKEKGVQPVRSEKAIEQSYGFLPGWVFTCKGCSSVTSVLLERLVAVGTR